ncbi:MAG: transcription antitermination factor NusB [Phycisphaerales bacterium]
MGIRWKIIDARSPQPETTSHEAGKAAAPSGRDAAVARLIVCARAFPDLPFGDDDDSSEDVHAQLPLREAQLARAIEQAAIRHWLTLVRVLESRMPNRTWDRVEPMLQGVLIAGAAQLLLLDRIPAHAAVDHAVEFVKQRGRPKATGFINGVLRSVDRTVLRKDAAPPGNDLPARTLMPLGDGRAVTLSDPIFANNTVLRIAQQTSHPFELVQRWVGLFGETATLELCMHNLLQPPILLSGLPASEENESIVQPHALHSASIFVGNHSELVALLERHPTVRVQDPTSALPVQFAAEFLRDRPPAVIADLCAGRGTKTAQLLETFPHAEIIATDVNPARVHDLKQRFAGEERVLVRPSHEVAQRFANGCDLLLLDVPCSNTGVLARRIEARYRAHDETFESLCSIQKQILADSLRLRNPGGVTVYATCSVDPRENQEQMQWLVKWHKLSVVAEKVTMPHGLPGDPPSIYQDGGYCAIVS